MEVKLPYGRTYLTASLPDHFGVDIIEAPRPPPAADPLGVVNITGLLRTFWERCSGLILLWLARWQLL